jgi:hypothetical protein
LGFQCIAITRWLIRGGAQTSTSLMSWDCLPFLLHNFLAFERPTISGSLLSMEASTEPESAYVYDQQVHSNVAKWLGGNL